MLTVYLLNLYKNADVSAFLEFSVQLQFDVFSLLLCPIIVMQDAECMIVVLSIPSYLCVRSLNHFELTWCHF